MQRDFPYRERFNEVVAPDAKVRLHAAILKHAVAKADKLGIPLVSADYAIELAARSAEVPMYAATSHLVMAASRGIREASDTLLHLHDWPQLAQRDSAPVSLLVYEPGLSPAEVAA
jgi:hypothetical protein